MEYLLQAGGWDAYNVTEDADLGIRLARMGYVSGMINSPTFEEAPNTMEHWLPQRTRWLKGWMQTLLVHLRNPIHLQRDLGWKNHLLLHLILSMTVLSVLIHPFFLVATLVQIFGFIFYQSSLFASTLFGLCIFNLMIGYLSYGFLAYAVITDSKLAINRKKVFLLPLYWPLISVARWRALYQLITAPHIWEKTPHGDAQRKTPEKMNNS